MRRIFSIFLYLVSFLIIQNAEAQFSISGTITNEEGTPLDGASIFLRLSDYATVSDERGRYSIDSIQAGDYEMKATYLGYKVYTDFYTVDSDIELDIILTGTIYDLNEIEIEATRLEDDAPFTYSTMGKEEIEKENLGQDIPFLLKNMPSTVVTSDAGAGIGYTGIRIRGSDPTRINVTINGIPLNDSESQGVFWVNIPDFAASTQDIQVQRGVGSSTNGVGAFGGTVGFNTHGVKTKSYVEAQLGYGTFNTNKMAIKAGTGLLNDQVSVDGRFSIINSDGYLDRSQSNLRSWMLSFARIGQRSSLRFDIFSGSEKTNQAWFGVPEAKITGNENDLLNHYQRNIGDLYNTKADSINLFESDRNYNYYLYPEQVDDYQQDHYQLHYSRKMSDRLTTKFIAHYTHGFGFFEEYRYQDDFEFYNIEDITVETGGMTDTLFFGDLVRRRWLDNDLFGGIWNNEYAFNERHQLDFGGSYQYYNGEHFGEVINIIELSSNDKFLPYYTNRGIKHDRHFYTKFKGNVSDHLSYLLDLQVRNVNYKIEGNDNKIKDIELGDNLTFFNPKAGITYTKGSNKAFISVAVANREPDRNDYINQYPMSLPKAERLLDTEIGYRFKNNALQAGANIYYMRYNDQLVLNGALNDVGANLRVNVDESYRRGIELDIDYQILENITLGANASFSQNKIESFNEILNDYATDQTIQNNYLDTDIAFSPNTIVNGIIRYTPIENLELGWNTKYVGQQYLDNTMNPNRTLDPYLLNDFSMRYSYPISIFTKLAIGFRINNVLGAQYVSNGYTYSYLIDGALTTENFYFPQAGRHFLLNVTLGI